MNKFLNTALVFLLFTGCASVDENGNKKKRTVLRGAGIGAAVGAATGAIFGKKGKRGKAAIIGAAAGTVVGAAAGALVKRKRALKAANLDQDKVSIEERDGKLYANLKGVNFASGKANLSAGGLEVISEIATVMKDFKQDNLYIAGHTDSVGTATSNQVLSENRAQSVYGAFVQNGISAQRMSKAGLGESSPIADNGSSEGRAQNRRVEIQIIPQES